MLTDLPRKLLNMPRGKKRLLVLSMDALISVWSTFAAIYLRIGEWAWLGYGQAAAVAVAVLLCMSIFTRSGVYRSILRHRSWHTMVILARACLVYGAIYSLIFTFVGIGALPRTTGLIQPLLLFLTAAAWRAAAQYLFADNGRRDVAAAGRNVIIYGAGQSGQQLAAALRNNMEMQHVAYFDDDKSLHNGVLQGIRVYDPTHAPAVIEDLEVTDVLLALPSTSRRRRQEIVALLNGLNVNIRTLPGLLDLARGEIQVSEIRPLEIEDLLGREPVMPDPELLQALVTGKVVMVSGGGGSIGSELCRQILALRPSHLLIVEMSEYALYAIHREMTERQAGGIGDGVRVVPLLASVLDENRLNSIMALFKPDTIYHAAAYKHVPLVEHNCLEGIRNNAFGTMTIARVAERHGVSDFVLISTDKAVRPTNVMGATKRLAELMVQALAAQNPGTRFSMVRFGNVLGSSGSVVPLFRAQIAAGGPVTITHQDVTRYFMTIPEAAQLVLQTGSMAKGGEVFVLDMGEPVLIRDLAVNMIRLSGLTIRDAAHPNGDIAIETIGLRPGEKMIEELLIGNNPVPTRHERIMQAREPLIALAVLERQLKIMHRCIVENDVTGAIAMLQKLVDEYRSDGSIVDHVNVIAPAKLASPIALNA